MQKRKFQIRSNSSLTQNCCSMCFGLIRPSCWLKVCADLTQSPSRSDQFSCLWAIQPDQVINFCNRFEQKKHIRSTSVDSTQPLSTHDQPLSTHDQPLSTHDQTSVHLLLTLCDRLRSNSISDQRILIRCDELMLLLVFKLKPRQKQTDYKLLFNRYAANSCCA